MRIAIATTGRFHVLDLARELSRLGHDVAFWSIVPHSRAVKFGLPSTAHRGLLPWLFPLVAAQYYGGTRLREWVTPLLFESADKLIAHRLEPCDVFIGMSGISVESARVARDRYGAKIFIERGSRHILSQKAIMDDMKRRGLNTEPVSEYYVERELAGYTLSDRVVIPSLHAEQSFLGQGFPAEKLFRNPYGVDLSMFPPTFAPTNQPPTLLYVGGWTYRKGVDLLEAAWRRLDGVNLLHVGPVGDAPLPDAPGFTHVDPVSQWRLSEYYARAHLFVLASREDGFGMVLSQALASGLPLVCTDRTGGEDLQRLLEEPSWVKVVSSDNADALTVAIQEMLPRALGLRGMRDLLGKGQRQLTWESYGKRYSEEIIRSTQDGKISTAKGNG